MPDVVKFLQNLQNQHQVPFFLLMAMETIFISKSELAILLFSQPLAAVHTVFGFHGIIDRTCFCGKEYRQISLVSQEKKNRIFFPMCHENTAKKNFS